MTHQTETDPSCNAVPAHQAARDQFLNDVLEGLARPWKSIPAKYFYDETGSRLFDRICELEQYYPTRTEMHIMQCNIRSIVDRIGPEALLVEYGSGSSLKTRVLLEHLERPAGYVPIDISKKHLMRSATRLRREFPEIDIYPVHADYSTDIEWPEPRKPARRTVVFFPGSTIGNFEPAQAGRFLERIAAICRPNGGLLIGVDLQKDPAVLEAAYNDREGVTAAFNLNLLHRINRELGADFDVARFSHRAFYNAERGRIEMHLVSRVDQAVTVHGTTFRFEAGETIHTENSYKYTLSQFAGISRHAGLTVRQVWTDAECLFSVQYLDVADRPPSFR